MNKPKTIYCPQCGNEVIHYDGRSTIDHIVNCKKCRKRIIYRVSSVETEIKPIPKRNCNSGMTFY